MSYKNPKFEYGINCTVVELLYTFINLVFFGQSVFSSSSLALVLRTIRLSKITQETRTIMMPLNSEALECSDGNKTEREIERERQREREQLQCLECV